MAAVKPPGIYLLGLTGGIACGKSSVLAMLADMGAYVLDADQVTRRLQQPGRPVYNQIVRTFGSEILVEPEGPIDRAKLGALVFNDPVDLRELEQIVHPVVRTEVIAWLSTLALQTEPEDQSASGGPRAVAVLDAIKLLESGWREYCDAVWVVTCAEEQQVERLIRNREMSEAEARERINAQPSQESRIEQADVVIDNSGTLEETRRRVAEAWQHIGIDAPRSRDN
jgi:dephospho-CoA kinase